MAIINCIARFQNEEGIFEYNEGVDDADFPIEQWVHNPDISDVIGTDQDLWKWDGSKVVIMTENEQMGRNDGSRTGYTLHNTGRMYMQPDARWICASDDVYGPTYYQWNESAGLGDDPVYEVEHSGFIMSEGETLTKAMFHVRGYTNTRGVSDIEILLAFRSPSEGRTFFNANDSDHEMENNVLLRDMFINPVDTNLWGGSMDGDIRDSHRRVVNVNFTAPKDGWLTLYLKPNVQPTSLTYVSVFYRLDLLASGGLN